MPHFNLRHFVQKLSSRRKQDVFVLQIGAMDGQLFDPMHEFIIEHQWNGLLVEPIAEQFEKLQHTYRDQPQIRLANVAIAEKQGTATMHHLPSEVVVQQNIPKWGYGATSFYADRNALAFDEIKPHVQQIEVDTQTLTALLEEQQVNKIDILQIDTEGYDYHILKQLDFGRYHPLIINMEIVNLPKEESNAAKRLLDEQGYLHAKAGYDLLAISPKLLAD